MKSNNIVLLPRRSPPGAENLAAGLNTPSSFSLIRLLKLSQLSQALIDCLAVIVAGGVIVLLALGTLMGIGILLFEATLGLG